MLDDLENFFQRHEHEIAALEAFSTFAAVAVSLVLALVSQRASRTRLKASAQVSIIMHSTIEENEYPSYLTASITNLGIMPVSVPMSFFHWKIPFKKGLWVVTPLDYTQADEWVPQKKYPIEIKPRASESFFLADLGAFRRNTYKSLFAKATFFDRCRLYFMRAIVITDDHKIFNVKIDGELRKELKLLRRAKTAPEEEEGSPRL